MGKVIMSGIVPQLEKPSFGIYASELAVGSIVKLMENGSPVDYIIVNQGIPSGSSLYDSSCDGTWLLRKDLAENRQWLSGPKNDYELSEVHSYLNNDFLNKFDSTAQSVIKTVKIPFQDGTGSGGSISSGVNGLSTRIFLLGGYEVGWTTSTQQYFPKDGACLSYFSGTASTDSKRIAYRSDGEPGLWWLRSPRTNSSSNVWEVLATGNYDYDTSEHERSIRPALILPFNATFDKNTLVLKGVA